MGGDVWARIRTPAARHWSSSQTDTAGLNKMEQLTEVTLAETACAEPQSRTLRTPYFVPKSPIAVGLQLWKLGRTWPASAPGRGTFTW